MASYTEYFLTGVAMFVLMNWNEIREQIYVYMSTHIICILFLLSGVMHYLKKIILCYGFQLYSLGDCFYISYFFVCFYRGKYRIVYLTPEFCSSNLELLRQLEADIGKWDDRIFISTC